MSEVIPPDKLWGIVRASFAYPLGPRQKAILDVLRKGDIFKAQALLCEAMKLPLEISLKHNAAKLAWWIRTPSVSQEVNDKNLLKILREYDI